MMVKLFLRYTRDEVTLPTVPILPQKSRLYTRTGKKSSSNSKRQPCFVSYPEFLASYWGHLSESLTRTLGKEWLFICDLL